MKGIIVVVEDNRMFRKILCDGFEDFGYLAVGYGDGLEAIEAIRGDLKYNMALIDLELPHCNGIEVMEASKKVNPNVPVILMSGYNDRPATKADEFIFKGELTSRDELRRLAKRYIKD